jgi:hypothetical protein
MCGVAQTTWEMPAEMKPKPKPKPKSKPQPSPTRTPVSPSVVAETPSVASSPTKSSTRDESSANTSDSASSISSHVNSPVVVATITAPASKSKPLIEGEMLRVRYKTANYVKPSARTPAIAAKLKNSAPPGSLLRSLSFFRIRIPRDGALVRLS